MPATPKRCCSRGGKWQRRRPRWGCCGPRSARHRHEFSAALKDLDRVLAKDPRNGQAWLMRSTILTVIGRYPEARQSCLALLRVADALVVTACLGAVESLTGRARASYAALDGAIQSAPEADPATRLWALTLLGELAARLGEFAQAERHFLEAMGLGRRDVYLLSAYADFLLIKAATRRSLGSCALRRASMACSCA